MFGRNRRGPKSESAPSDSHLRYSQGDFFDDYVELEKQRQAQPFYDELDKISEANAISRERAESMFRELDAIHGVLNHAFLQEFASTMRSVVCQGNTGNERRFNHRYWPDPIYAPRETVSIVRDSMSVIRIQRPEDRKGWEASHVPVWIAGRRLLSNGEASYIALAINDQLPEEARTYPTKLGKYERTFSRDDETNPNPFLAYAPHLYDAQNKDLQKTVQNVLDGPSSFSIIQFEGPRELKTMAECPAVFRDKESRGRFSDGHGNFDANPSALTMLVPNEREYVPIVSNPRPAKVDDAAVQGYDIPFYLTRLADQYRLNDRLNHLSGKLATLRNAAKTYVADRYGVDDNFPDGYSPGELYPRSR